MDIRIEKVDPSSLRKAEVNARFMSQEQFKQLVSNIKRDGVLSSTPFAARDPDGGYTVLSGNHRVAAAVEAGLESIDCMLTDDELTKDQRTAIQLSHNALVGQDDLPTLAKLYDSVDSVDMKVYAGLDDKTLDLLAEVDSASLSHANMRIKTVTIAFFPDEAEEQRKRLASFNPPPGEVWLARHAVFDRLLDLMRSATTAYDIRNTAVGFDVLARIAENHLDDLAEGWEDTPNRGGRVPLESIFGTYEIRHATAQRLRKAMQKCLAQKKFGKTEKSRLLDALLDAFEKK